MIPRLFKYIVTGIAIVLMTSCDPLPEEEQIEFFLSKKWQLVDLQMNGFTDETVNISRYTLDFKEDQTMTRTNFDGSTQQGNWALANADRELVIFEGEAEEQRFLIIDIQIRRLELQTLITSSKTGAAEFRFTFDPA